MTKVKYPGQKINTKSFLEAYEPNVLKKLKNKFHLTDAFVTYSWGFNRETEKVDYEFVASKLGNFKQLNINAHAYVQGCNLVLSEHKDKDFFCRDYRGSLVPYHRNRKVTCVNNPKFNAYMVSKIESALKLDFDGVFVDNVHFGQFPLLIGQTKTSFFGCNCRYCQRLFRGKTGAEIPELFDLRDELTKQYLEFRSQSINEWLRNLADLVRSAGKQFGSNSFDPFFDSKLFYGTNLSETTKVQDYLLFENHDLPRLKRSNYGVKKIITKAKKPVFIVSYKQGIGRDGNFSQTDFDSIFTEANSLGYVPCYKMTEFVTNGVWHAIDPDKFQPVSLAGSGKFAKRVDRKLTTLPWPMLAKLYNRLYSPLLATYFENRLARGAFSWVFYKYT